MDNSLILRIAGNRRIDNVDILSASYEHWRINKSANGAPFFAIYKDIESILSEVSTGALKLYIYYGFASNNITGESWHSIATISSSLDKVPKTIENWNNELEKIGWIKRISNGKPSKSTFLLPLSDFAQMMKSKTNFLEWVNSSNFNSTYGRINDYIHYVIKGKKIKTFNHFFVIEVVKDYGTKNKRRIYYYYEDKSITLKPAYEEDSLDDTIYSLQFNDAFPIINNIKPRSFFICEGADLSKKSDIIELSKNLIDNRTDAQFRALEWEV